MVQILEDNSPQTQRMAAFSKLFGNIGQSSQNLKGVWDESQTRSALAQRFGEEFKNIKNPRIQELLASKALDKENQAEKLKGEADLEKKDYEWIKKKFGEDIANFWKASPVGGRTKLTEALIQQGLRHLSPEEIFGEEGAEEEEDIFSLPGKKTPKLPEQAAKTIKNVQGQEFQLPNHSKRPKGLLEKDWIDRKDKWDTRNTEIFQKNRDRMHGLERDMLGAKELNNLNESHKLPEGFDRLILNPSTGEPYKLAQLAEIVSPEAQEWVKIIAQFGNRAKEAFGSRVTNFDLTQYMKQFPSLMNSYEGRKRILRMMDINYQLDYVYDQALRQIYDEAGTDNIAPNEADRLARQMVQEDRDRLEDEYLNLDRENIQEVSLEGQKGKKKSLEEIFG